MQRVFLSRSFESRPKPVSRQGLHPDAAARKLQSSQTTANVADSATTLIPLPLARGVSCQAV
jgi:hypothetical protein